MADLLSPFAGSDALNLAGALRTEFGTLSSALQASDRQLLEAGHAFPEAIKLILAARALVDTARRETAFGTEVHADDPAMLDYLQVRLCRGPKEHLLIIFCDESHRYIIDEEMGLGSTSYIRLDSAHLIRRALTIGAASLLLAHNHPSGRCRPSEHDIAGTRYLKRVAGAYGIGIIDHLVVTRDATFSMQAAGVLQ